MNEKVETWQRIAIQRNTFGEVVAEYTSPITGEVAARRTDATSKPGNMLLFMLYQRAEEDDPVLYPE